MLSHLVHLTAKLDLAANQILCQTIVLLLQSIDVVPELFVLLLKSEHRVL